MTSEAPALPRGGIRLWLQAVRIYAFPASAVPLALGALSAYRSGAALDWWLLPAVLVGGFLLHAACNLQNDRDDYVRGVDRPGTKGGNGLLVAAIMTPQATERAALICLGVAAAIGIPIAILRGWPLLLVGAAGVLGAWGYTARGRGYKYLALGDPMVGILMGPLMVLGSHLALGAPLAWAPVALSAPVACLVIAILAANNLRDIDDDSAAGVTTLAILLGQRGALVWYLLLLAGAYLSLGALVLTRALPWTALAALLSLPIAIGNARRAIGGVVRSRPELLDAIVIPTAQLHLAFGAPMIAGTLVFDLFLR
jgi:1,4-dihydroxy-2-naphthoate octaprenyltransferase